MIQSNNEGIQIKNYNEDGNNDEIDLSSFIRIFLRGKFIILSFGFVGFFYGLISGVLKEPTWQGEFQIVLSKPSSASTNVGGASQRSMLLSSFGLNTSNNQLTTEVKILESPSVLMPTFDFLKNEKLKIGNKNFKNVSFRGWRNNFNANLMKDTSVLNVTYKDKNKDLVIPVLENITKIYQDYSNKNRLRNIELAIKYFDEQILIYKEISKKSIKKANDFGLKYSLAADSNIGNKVSAAGVGFANVAIDVEIKRKDAMNRIFKLENQLIQAYKLGDDPQKAIGMLSILPGIKEGLGGSLQSLNNDLAMKRAVYNDNSSNIQIILEQRKNLVFAIKKQIIGFLNANIENQKAILESTKREDGVITKYKELLKEATKNSIVLNNLETRYQSVKLEKARKEDPWELITNPTLLPDPVEPIISELVLSRTIFGIIIGTFFIFILDRFKGQLYEFDKLDKLFNSKSIINLSFKNENEFNEIIELISRNNLSGLKDSLCILYIGDIPSILLKSLKSNFEQQLSDVKITFTKEIRELMKFKNVILLLSKGDVNKNEFARYRQNLAFIDNQFFAIMVIENSKNIREI